MIEVEVKLKRKNFNLDVSLNLSSPVTAIFGPSGAGKSTLLSIIAGITKPDQGRIILQNKCLFDSSHGINLPIHTRGVGLVFQDSRLFPHMTVAQNLNYAHQFGKQRHPIIKSDEVIQLLALNELLSQRPNQLSGGEKQRVALGRVLLSAPQLLMLDEPLASLDGKLKLQILPYLKRITEVIQVPMIYVSHHLDEIHQLTNTVINLEQGQIFNIQTNSTN